MFVCNLAVSTEDDGVDGSTITHENTGNCLPMLGVFGVKELGLIGGCILNLLAVRRSIPWVW